MLLFKCGRFQEVLMLECRIGLCAERANKERLLECLRRCYNYVKTSCAMLIK